MCWEHQPWACTWSQPLPPCRPSLPNLHPNRTPPPTHTQHHLQPPREGPGSALGHLTGHLSRAEWGRRCPEHLTSGIWFELHKSGWGHRCIRT